MHLQAVGRVMQFCKLVNCCVRDLCFTARHLPCTTHLCKSEKWFRFSLSSSSRSADDEGVPTLDGSTLSTQNFESKFLRTYRPCIIDGLADGWPALRESRWSFEKLRELYGGRYFECGRTGFDDDPVIISMTAFLEGMRFSATIDTDNYSSPQYIFDATFDADCPELLLDYTVPHLFRGAARDALAALPAGLRPDFRWFLVGGAGSGSALHRDPLGTAAWNTVVVGEKRWAMLGPASCFSHGPTRAGLHDTSVAGDSGHRCCGAMAAVAAEIAAEAQGGAAAGRDPAQWFERRWPAIRDAVSAAKAAAAAAGRRCDACAAEATQGATQTVLVPCGWLHAVVNTRPSVAITHNWLPPAREAPLLRALQAGTAGMAPAQAAACRRILLARARPPPGRPAHSRATGAAKCSRARRGRAGTRRAERRQREWRR